MHPGKLPTHPCPSAHLHHTLPPRQTRTNSGPFHFRQSRIPTTFLLALLSLLAAPNLARAQSIRAPNSTPGPSHPGRVSAIDPLSLPLIEPLGLEAAKEKALQTKRLLLIFWCGDTPQNPDWSFCRSSKSLSLRAYIKWHCIAIQTRTLPDNLTDIVCRTLRAQSQETPAIIILRDGRVEQIVGTDVPMAKFGADPFPSSCPPYRCTPNCFDTGCGCKQFIPGPVRILYQTDFALDRIKARDPVWAGLHDLANPAPQPPPEPEPFSNTKDDLAPIVWDPRPEEHIGALDRLQQARNLVKSGDLYQATGIYSWLWERAADTDPSFRPAKLSAVAQDISALIATRPGARERFEKIRAARTDRVLWAEFGQMHDWFVLNFATNNAEETVEYLDYFVNDTDESAMLPPADALAFKLLARRDNFANAWERPLPARTRAGAPPPNGAGETALARVNSIVQRLNPKFPSSITDSARDEYRAFARQFLLDEGARLYVASLINADELAAHQIALAILAARNDPITRLSLITTALAADPPQARPIHLTWLDESEAAGAPARPDLRTRLILATNPAPKP